jgi:hypothetical protein
MSWADKALVAESVVMLAAARLLIVTTRQQRLVSRMGGTRLEGTELPPAAELAPARRTHGARLSVRIGASVERVARFTWWRSMCLERALAGKWMLRRRGIPSTMYVGMARQGEHFVAHAWLVGDGLTLTGAGKTAYAPLAAFREPLG